MGSSRVDTITREVLRHKFESIADEMQTTLVRSAYSSVIKESEDATSCLFDRQGRTLAQASANPGHHRMLIPAVQAILDAHPKESIEPGELYLLNDPYYGSDDIGGTHIPDITLLKPVFYEDELVAFTTTMGHH